MRRVEAALGRVLERFKTDKQRDKKTNGQAASHPTTFAADTVQPRGDGAVHFPPLVPEVVALHAAKRPQVRLRRRLREDCDVDARAAGPAYGGAAVGAL